MPVDVVTFDVDLGVSFDPVTTIGTVYEVGINGVGYMLADDPEKPEQRYRRTVTPLEPQRLATGDTPFSEAVQRIQFANMVDWSGGRGQTSWDRDDSDHKAFKDGYGVDPFTQPGKLSVLPATALELSSAYAGLTFVVVGGVLYVQTDDDELTPIENPGDAPLTPITIAGAGVITDLTSDGQYWYAADGTDVFRGTTADPGSSWSNLNAARVQWAAGRIMAAVIASGSTPNRLTSLTPSGNEERAGGHLTLDAGRTIVLGGSASGYYYFASYAGGESLVWAWKLGLDDAGDQFFPFVAWDCPTGTTPTAIGTAGGSVFITLYSSNGGDPVQSLLYRLIPNQDGSLTAFLLDEIATEPRYLVDHDTPSKMSTINPLLFFPWPTMHIDPSDDSPFRSGIGAVSLTSGGYAKWLSGPDDSEGGVSCIGVWQGLTLFSVLGKGIYVEAETLEPSGRLDMSVVDGKTSLTKVLDKVTLHFDPLLTGQSITVSISTDDGVSYSPLGTVSTPGAIRASLVVDEEAFSFGLRVELAGPGTTGMTVMMHEMQYHVIGLADTYLQLPVNCADNITLLNQRPAPENGKGKGMARARLLQDLVQTRVLFQDIDYWLTSQSEIWEVVSVDIMSTHFQNRQKGGVTAMQVAVLTLRRVGP